MDLESALYTAIIKWFDDALEDWGTIDNEEWIHYVCKEIGITRAEYKRIMLIDKEK